MSAGTADRLLLDCLTGRSFPRADDTVRWRKIVDRSVRHGVSPYLFRLLKNGDVALPAEERAALQRLYLETAGANAGLFHELGVALRALKAAGIPVIVLKGAYFAEAVYRDIAMRPMCDVDLLVKRSDLSGAQEAIIASGYRPQHGALPVDLHWGLGTEHRYLRIDMEGVWKRAVPAVVAGVEVLRLADGDLIVDFCTHLSCKHLFEAGGIRPLLDIREICESRGDDFDWQTVLQRARQWGNAGGVYASLLLARDLLGAEVPLDVLDDLHPDGFDSRAVSWAADQVFRDRPGHENVCLSPYYWRLWGDSPLRDKWRNLRTLLFPSREFLFLRYPVEENSPKRFLYYLKRYWDFSAGYGSLTCKILLRDEKAVARARRENRNMAMRDLLISS